MMGTIFIGVLVTVLMLVLFGLTIFVHELGHYIAARRLGLVVEAFSIGFGPPIWQRKINGVRYKIGAIPLGGYVALPQLDPTAMNSVQGGDKSSTGEKPNLPAIAPWRKIVVSLAGSLGNVFFAVLLAWLIALNPHAITGGDDTRLGLVEENTAAYETGLRPGDIIRKVNDQKVATWTEFMLETHLSAGDEHVVLTVESPGMDQVEQWRRLTVPVVRISDDLRGIEGVAPGLLCLIAEVNPDSPAERAGIMANDIVKEVDGVQVVGSRHLIELISDRAGQETMLTIRRRDQVLLLSVIPRLDEELGRPLIGVRLDDARSRVPMWMQYRRPWRQIENDFRQIARILRALVMPRTPGERGHAAGSLGGPVAIMFMLWVSVQSSLLNSLGFVRFLNVNLAVLNLLPLPILDGGHIMFSLWEMVTRRRASPRLVNILVHVFAVLLIFAVLMITRNDIVRLWRGFFSADEIPQVETVDPGKEGSPDQSDPANAP